MSGIRTLRIVGIYVACAALWILISDKALFLLTGDPAQPAAIGTLKGWIFVAVSSLALYIALRRESRYSAQSEGDPDLGAPGRASWNWIAVFLVVSSILVMIGWSVYEAMDSAIRSRENDRIEAIAEFKKDQVAAWLAERRGDIVGYMDSSYLADVLERTQAGNSSKELNDLLASRLETTLRVRKYVGTELLDAEGKAVASVGEPAVREDRFRSALRTARSSSDPVLLDLDRAAPSAPIRMGFVAAVRDSRRPDRPVVGFAAFTMDPAEVLFPMLGGWPTKGGSGETVLARRDGADAVFLTPLGLGNSTPMGLHMPLTRTSLPVVKALTRGAGTYEGTDYRGVAVLAAFRAVPGTPWLLGVKIDQKEVYSGVGTVFLVCILLIGGGTVIAGAMLTMAWRHQRLRDRFRHLDLQDQLAKVAASAPGLVCSFRLRPDGSAALPIASPAILDLFGLTPEQVAEDATPIFDGMPPEDATRIMVSVQSSAETMEPWHGEFRFRHPAKGERWIEGHSVPKRESDGGILWHGYVHDVTDRKRAEIELLAARDRIFDSEARLQLVQSAAELGWWEWVVETGQQTWSPANYRLHGIDPAAGPVSYDTWLAAVHPDDRESAAAAAAATVSIGGVYETDYRVILSDGSVRWLIGRGRLVTDASGATRRMLGINLDITRLKRAEADLARANNLLRARNLGNLALLQAADEFSYLRAACGIVVEACGHTMMWVGYADPGPERRVLPVAVAGLDAGYLEDIQISWADDEQGRGPTGTAIRTGQPVVCMDTLSEARFEPWRTKAEQLGYRSSLALPLVGEAEIIGALTIYATQVGSFGEGEVRLLSEIANDIARGVSVLRLRAAHARTEQALRDSETKLRFFIEHAPAALAMVDTDMRYLFASNRWLTDYHLDARDIVGKSHYEIFPEIPERWKEIHRRCLAGAVERCEEDAFVRLDGRTDWLRWAIHPWYSGGGSVGGIVMMSEDITEKKHNQEELDRYRTHLEDLVAERTRQLVDASRLAEARATEVADLYDNAPCGYHSLDTTGLFLRINDTELSWLGYRREEVVGRMRFSDLLDERGRAAFKQNFPQFLANGYLYDREYELYGKDGRAIPVLISATASRNESGAIMTSRSVVYNITDLKAVERVAAYHARLADAVFRHSVACLVVLDRDYNFLRVNEAYARACRRDIEEFTGRNHFEMYPSDTKVIFDDVVRTKRPFETFTRAFIFPDQPERGMTYWDWTLVPILDQAGEVEYLVFSLRGRFKSYRTQPGRVICMPFVAVEAGSSPIV